MTSRPGDARLDSAEMAARRARFEAIFAAGAPAVMAYTRRRTNSEADAEDAVGDTFAIAWRRLDDVPGGELTLPWLYATARRKLASQRRSGARWLRLKQRLQWNAPSPVSPVGSGPGHVLEALDRLKSDDRELLKLVAWEELSHAQIASILGITSNAVAIRLHRARHRLARELGLGRLGEGRDSASDPGPTEHILKDVGDFRTSGEVKGPRAGKPRQGQTG